MSPTLNIMSISYITVPSLDVPIPEESVEDSEGTESDPENDIRLRCPPITESPETSSPSDPESEMDTMPLGELKKRRLKSQSTGKRVASASSSTKKVTKGKRGKGKKPRYTGPCTCFGQCGKLISGTTQFTCRKKDDGTSTCTRSVVSCQGLRLCPPCYRTKCRLDDKLAKMKDLNILKLK